MLNGILNLYVCHMRFGFLFLLIGILLGIAPARAQVDDSGQTTKQEMVQIRRLAVSYAKGWVNSSDIDWHNSEVWRIDLDGDGVKEAVFTYVGSTICGASTCRMLIIKWFGRKAQVMALIGDGPLQRLNTKTNGWHDLLGHYHLYKWTGTDYERLCLPDRGCYDG